MIDIVAVDLASPKQIWAYVVATHALEDAASRLRSAGVLLDALAEATQWRVAAGQHVHAQVLGFRSQVRGAADTVRDLRGLLEQEMAR